MCHSRTVSMLCVVDPERHLWTILACVDFSSRAIGLNKDGDWPASKHFVRRQRWHFCLTLYRMLHRSPLTPPDRWRHVLYSYNGTMALRRWSARNVSRDIYDGLQSIATKECWKECRKRLVTWWHPWAHLCKIRRRSDRNYDRERDQHTQHTLNRLYVVWKESIGRSHWLTSLSVFRNAKQLLFSVPVSQSEEAYRERSTRLVVVRLDARSVSDRWIVEIEEKKSLMIDWMKRGENPRIIIAVHCCHNQEFRCFPFPVVACAVPSWCRHHHSHWSPFTVESRYRKERNGLSSILLNERWKCVRGGACVTQWCSETLSSVNATIAFCSRSSLFHTDVRASLWLILPRRATTWSGGEPKKRCRTKRKSKRTRNERTVSHLHISSSASAHLRSTRCSRVTQQKQAPVSSEDVGGVSE